MIIIIIIIIIKQANDNKLIILMRQVFNDLSQIPSTIKVKIVDKMMQNAYLCVILHVKHKKLSFLEVLT